MTLPQGNVLLSEDLEDEIYPDSDGKPMGETDYHIAALVYLRLALQGFFRPRQDIYVATDMFLYYEEGNVKARVAPDVMVVFGVHRHFRRSFKLWREAVGPQVMIELASGRTWRKDMQHKPELYASLNVQEYYVFDPERRFLKPPLRGFRRHGRSMVERPLAADGGLMSNRLGLRLVPEGGLLRLVDPQTRKPLLTADELADKAAQEAERAAQEAGRAAQAEAELARLRSRARKKPRQV
jgi:Uma2 family endonuclease